MGKTFARYDNCKRAFSELDTKGTIFYIGRDFAPHDLLAYLIEYQLGIGAVATITTYTHSEEFQRMAALLLNEKLAKKITLVQDRQALRLPTMHGLEASGVSIVNAYNHSKIMLINNAIKSIAVITSANCNDTTRNESYLVTTNQNIIKQVWEQLQKLTQ